MLLSFEHCSFAHLLLNVFTHLSILYPFMKNFQAVSARLEGNTKIVQPRAVVNLDSFGKATRLRWNYLQLIQTIVQLITLMAIKHYEPDRAEEVL